MKVTYTDLVCDIVCGNLDSDLKRIMEVVRSRQDEIKEKQASLLYHTLQVGDTVYFTQTGRPTYLRGVKATVKKFRTKKIVVDLDRPVRKFWKNIICPAELLTTVAP